MRFGRRIREHRGRGGCVVLVRTEASGGIRIAPRARAARPDGRDRDRALRRTAAASERPCLDCRCSTGSNAQRTSCMVSRSTSREHLRHVGLLVGAHAVLAGDRAARLDAVVQDLGRDRLGVLGLAGNRGVVADQRVQVAVAGVKDVADAQPRALREIADAPQHFGQLRPRHDAVLHVVVRRDPSHRGKRRLASFPDPLALALVARDLHRRRRPPRGTRARRRRRVRPLRSADHRARRSAPPRNRESSGGPRLPPPGSSAGPSSRPRPGRCRAR